MSGMYTLKLLCNMISLFGVLARLVALVHYEGAGVTTPCSGRGKSPLMMRCMILVCVRRSLGSSSCFSKG